MDVDERLVRRLESSAAAATLELVAALDAPATGETFGSGALIAMGPTRYVNRAMGVTLDALADTDVDALERFYVERGLAPAVEVSAWAHPSTVAELGRRHYTPGWFRAMFAMRLTGLGIAHRADVQIEPVHDGTVAAWLAVYADGFGVIGAHARATSDEFALAVRSAPSAHAFLASVDGTPVGCGFLQVADGVAWLGGAATLPEWRGRGVQAALVDHRLRLAARLGADLAGVTAVPAGASARNVRRLGFVPVDTQVVLVRS